MNRVVADVLYGISPTDPVTYCLAAAMLAIVSLVGSWVPARRGARVDPVIALRAD